MIYIQIPRELMLYIGLHILKTMNQSFLEQRCACLMIYLKKTPQMNQLTHFINLFKKLLVNKTHKKVQKRNI